MDCSESGNRLSPLCLALLPFQKLQVLQQDQCSLAYVTLPQLLFDVTRAVVDLLLRNAVFMLILSVECIHVPLRFCDFLERISEGDLCFWVVALPVPCPSPHVSHSLERLEHSHPG